MIIEWLFIISVSAFVLSMIVSIVLSVCGHKRFMDVLAFVLTRGLAASVSVSAIILLFGVYFYGEGDSNISAGNIGRTLAASLQHTMCLFVLDGSYTDVLDTVGTVGNSTVWTENIKWLYSNYSAFLYVAAPVATFGFILSFLKNLLSNMRYRFLFWKETHIFSELNEKSLALAANIRASEGWLLKPLVVFTDVPKNSEEETDLIADAKNFGAVLLYKDFESVKYKLFGKRKLHFYLISDDENTKMHNAASVIENYNYTGASLYIFSDSTTAISFLDSYTEQEKTDMKIKIIRVNDIRSLVYSNLDKNGIQLFKNASPDNGVRRIKAVVVGLGRYGTETVKALLWYCQIPGYTVDILAIDQNPKAKDLFSEKCPALVFDKECNDEGDVKYKLNIKQATAGTKEFNDLVADTAPTYVFISLGNDEINLKTAVAIRCALAQKGNENAYIQTVVYNSDVKKRISVKNASDKFKTFQTKFNIHTIGDLESFYSHETVIKTDLIEEGLKVHKRWSKKNPNAEKDFYLSDYNFTSSVARALHGRLRRGVLEFEKENARLQNPPVFTCIEDYKEFPQTRGQWYKYIFEQTSDVAQSCELNAFLSECVATLEQKAYSLELLPEGQKFSLDFFKGLSPDAQAELKQSIADKEYENKVFTVEQICEAIEYAAEIEHVRWNAYMYSDGFVYNTKKEACFKMHSNLVPVSELTLEIKINDI